MSTITLVRHGQASFFGPDYDELSPLGQEQCSALGRYWQQTRRRFDQVYAGPLNRHRQTVTAVAAGFGDQWPAAQTLDGLVEHQSIAVVRHASGIQDLSPAGITRDSTDAERRAAKKHYFGLYVDIVRRWAIGDLEVPGIESWRQARERVADTLHQLAGSRRRRIVAFTSGGVVAMAIGDLLGLDDETVFELSLDVRNSSMTEIRLSSRRRALLSFNGVPHLVEQHHHTLV